MTGSISGNRPETSVINSALARVEQRHDLPREGEIIEIFKSYSNEMDKVSQDGKLLNKDRVSNVTASEKVKAFFNSRIVRGIIAFVVFTTAMSLVLGLCLGSLALNPWIWVGIAFGILIYGATAATAIGAFGGKGTNVSFKEWKLEHEMEGRYLFKKGNYDVIDLSRINSALAGQGKIILSSIPNRGKGAAQIAEEERLAGVLSINSKQELQPVGFMHPMTPEHYEDLGVAFARITCDDHKPLTVLQLNAAAEFIHAIVSNGGNLLVHCKAGQGRSAMAVAAYLIKYCRNERDENTDVTKAAQCITASRPKSTLLKKHSKEKLKALDDFALRCTMRNNRDEFVFGDGRAWGLKGQS